MANETKVGLLVGMSFIVVFALLLANRGSKQTPAVVRKPAVTRGQLVNPGTVSSVEERMKTAALGSGETADTEQYQLGSPTAAPEVRQAEDRQPETRDQVPPASAFKRLEDQIRYSPMPKPSQSGFAEAQPDLSDWKNEGVLEDIEAPKATVLTSKSPEPPVPGATEFNSDMPVAERSHVVKKGETLYKIARDVYGSSSKDVIDYIYKANRDTMKSPNTLNEGDKLVLPEIADGPSAETVKTQPPPAAPASDIAEKKADKPGSGKDGKDSKQKKDAKGKASGKKISEDTPKFRWYQVGKGDRFATIAAKQMGDKGKWQELADFNKDIFPNPAKIRPGVRIKIPVEKLASAN